MDTTRCKQCSDELVRKLRLQSRCCTSLWRQLKSHSLSKLAGPTKWERAAETKVVNPLPGRIQAVYSCAKATVFWEAGMHTRCSRQCRPQGVATVISRVGNCNRSHKCKK